MKKLLAVVLATTMMLSTLTGCKKAETPVADPTVEPTTAEELVWNIKTDPKSWDPGLNANNEGGHISLNIFEGLMRETSKGVECGAAESYEVSEDGKTYTFKLRQDAKWTDGQGVTAKDFIYAWTRVCDPATAAVYSFIMTPYIKGADAFANGTGSKEDIGLTAVDDYTLKVELNFPVPYFLNLTSFYTYLPVREEAVANGEGWEKNVETCLSNGPFKLTEYKSGLHVIIEKNENYWNKDAVKINKVKGVMINEATTALQGYQAGELQALDAVPQDEISNLKASDPNFSLSPLVKNYYYIMNIDKAPTDNVLVRKALALAIDRKGIIDKVTKGGETPATGVVPPNLRFSDDSSFRKLDSEGNPMPEYGIDPNKAQVEEAQKLLAEAGYPNGEGFPEIELLYNVEEFHQKVAEAIQEMWKTNLNINVKLRNEDNTTFRKSCFEGNYNIAKCSWGGDYDDPFTMLDIFTSYSGINNTQWRWQAYAEHTSDLKLNESSKRFDDALDNAVKTSGTERDEWLRSAERQLIEEEMIVIPIMFPSKTIIIDESVVEGVYMTTMGSWKFDEALLI